MEYKEHLHEERWSVTRYVNGKGFEISENPFNVWNLSIKICNNRKEAEEYVNSRANTVRAGFSVDFRTLPEVSDGTLDYIFVTEAESGKLINSSAIEAWKNKLTANGYLILHTQVLDNYEFHVFNKDGNEVTLPEKKPKHCCIIRYGAFGDMIQTSSVFPELKRQGYYITVVTSQGGVDIIKNDPHVDEIILQEREVVRNWELGVYWEWLKKRYDKFINFSESVEATFLPHKDKMPFHWPWRVRHELLNKNYVEMMHKIAQIPYELKAKFYPTEEEIAWAKAERAKMPEEKIIVWTFAGSSVHKVFPYFDEYVARVMTQLPNVGVVTIGSPETHELEGGWQREPRVHRRAGVWHIRQTLTFTKLYADLVVGPETGVMNAVCREAMPKIIFLSHSTHENLTRDWRNTYVMHPDYEEMDKACQNCCLHRLHYGWDYCTRGPEFGAALCQEKLDRARLWTVTVRALETGKVKA